MLNYICSKLPMRQKTAIKAKLFLINFQFVKVSTEIRLKKKKSLIQPMAVQDEYLNCLYHPM